MFTDGSFFPGRTCASWSVVVFGQQQGTLCRVGVMAGPCVLFRIDAGPDHCPSAYDGELEALVHALAICALSSACICHVGADCSSALSVVMGFSGFRAEHRLPAAAVGLAASVMAQRRQLCAHKVDAHTGCLGTTHWQTSWPNMRAAARNAFRAPLIGAILSRPLQKGSWRELGC